MGDDTVARRVTVGAVTASVGVKYSTFYRHFTSLDALVTALVDQVYEQELILGEVDEADHVRVRTALDEMIRERAGDDDGR